MESRARWTRCFALSDDGVPGSRIAAVCRSLPRRAMIALSAPSASVCRAKIRRSSSRNHSARAPMRAASRGTRVVASSIARMSAWKESTPATALNERIPAPETESGQNQGALESALGSRSGSPSRTIALPTRLRPRTRSRRRSATTVPISSGRHMTLTETHGRLERKVQGGVRSTVRQDTLGPATCTSARRRRPLSRRRPVPSVRCGSSGGGAVEQPASACQRTQPGRPS